MFTLNDIDTQIWVLTRAATDLYDKAEAEDYAPKKTMLRCYADGLREGARLLERMIQNAIEDEARDAMRRAS